MGATLFEFSLYRAIDDYRRAMSLDLDTEGEHRFLLELARSVVERDDVYQQEMRNLQASRDLALKSGEKDWEEVNRDHNLRHLGLMVAALRRAGYLDHAPIPESDSGLNFL